MKKSIIKRLLVVLMTIMVVASMAISAYAITPKFKVPSIKIPDITNSVKENIKISDTFWDNYFKEHPIKIDFSNVKLG